MGTWIDWLGEVVFDAGVSASALLAATALALVVTRQPARRLHVARTAIIGLIALFPLVGLRLVPRLDVIAGAETWVAGGAPAAARWSPPGPWLSRALTLAYLAGVGWQAARLGLGHLGLFWLVRTSTAPSAAAQAMFDELATTRGIRRPRLRVARRVRRPVLLGSFRPVVLVPPELDPPRPTAETWERLRLAVLHELAHAEAGDPWFTTTGRLAQALWFVLPPLWWVVGRMRLDQEFLADQRAAQRFGPPRYYASTLLQCATLSAAPRGEAPPAPAMAASAHGPGSALVDRMLMLLRCPFPVEPRPPAWWTRGLACLAVVATLLAASLSVRSTPLRPSSTPEITTAAAAQRPGPPRTFRVTRLDVPPHPLGARGLGRLVELPIRLPDQFELTLEVWADPAALRRTRVVGLPLGDPPPREALAPASTEKWHAVRVRRDRNGLALHVDERPVAVPDEPHHLTTWLAVEPPAERHGRFRSLRLDW